MVGFRDKQEIEQAILEEDVNWLRGANGQLTPFELSVYRTYLVLQQESEGFVPSNKDIATALTSDTEIISRNNVEGARKRIADKMGYKGGW